MTAARTVTWATDELDGVIWDWNGTLLDDLDHCVAVVDAMLHRRGWGTMDRARYQELFGFPVRDYYVAAGFRFEEESFEDLSEEFIARYQAGASGLRLHGAAQAVLRRLAQLALPQAVLSATREDMLLSALAHHEIGDRFAAVAGTGDIYAHGKLGRGQALLRETGWTPSRVVLIGDTLHDAEVAAELGCRCLLVAAGHQKRARLEAAGVPVVADLQAMMVHGPARQTPHEAV